MYTEDQFEPLMRNSCKADNFQIHTNISDNQLNIHLKTSPSHKQYFRYSTSLTINDLQGSLQGKFENLKDLQAFICDVNNISVDLYTGTISLIISISLYNGKTITTKLGEIKLKQDIFDSQKLIQKIIKSCDSKNIFSQFHYVNTIKQFASMFQVIFKKFQVLQGNQSHKNRQTFFTFKNNQKSNERNNNYSLDKVSGKAQIQQNKKSIYASFSSYMDKNTSSMTMNKIKNKYNADPIKVQLQSLKQQTRREIQRLMICQEQFAGQYDSKLQQLKKYLKTQIHQMRKGSTKQIQNRKLSSPALNKFNESFDNFMVNTKFIHSAKSDHKSEKKIQNYDLMTQIDEKQRKLKAQFDQFSQQVMCKFQKVGQNHSIIQSKLRKVIIELDLKMQEKILQQASKQLQQQIIDKQAPYFKQFQLKGTQIMYKGQDSLSTMILSKIKISQKNTFSVKLVKTLVSNIQIGLVDSTERNKRDCWLCNNFILYVGWNSAIYQGPNNIVVKQGEPLREGDIVTLKANIQTGLIQWFVNDQVRVKITWQKLMDKQINWVPVIRFYDSGDIVSWMTDKMLRFIR